MVLVIPKHLSVYDFFYVDPAPVLGAACLEKALLMPCLNVVSDALSDSPEQCLFLWNR